MNASFFVPFFLPFFKAASHDAECKLGYRYRLICPTWSAYFLLLKVLEKDSLEPEEKVLGGVIRPCQRQLS